MCLADAHADGGRVTDSFTFRQRVGLTKPIPVGERDALAVRNTVTKSCLSLALPFPQRNPDARADTDSDTNTDPHGDAKPERVATAVSRPDPDTVRRPFADADAIRDPDFAADTSTSSLD